MTGENPNYLINYAREQGLDDKTIQEWFMWAIQNLMSTEDILEGIKLKRNPREHWRNESRDQK